jgi:hypothetical protein
VRRSAIGVRDVHHSLDLLVEGAVYGHLAHAFHYARVQHSLVVRQLRFYI